MIRHHNHRRLNHRRLALESMETRICLDGAACAENVVDQEFVRRETDEGVALIREQTVNPSYSDSVEMGGAEPVGANVLVSNDSVDAAATVEIALAILPPPAGAETVFLQGTLNGEDIGGEN